MKYLFYFLSVIGCAAQSYVGWPAYVTPTSTNVPSLGSTNINMTPNGNIWATNKLDLNAQDIAITGTNAITFRNRTNIVTITNGFVGIGTNSPISQLHVVSIGTGSPINISRGNNSTYKAAIGFIPAGTFSTTTPAWECGMSDSYNDYVIQNWNGSSITRNFTVAANGNVFIGGIFTPSAKFHVISTVGVTPIAKLGTGNDVDGRNFNFINDGTNTTFALNQTGTEAVAPVDWRLENRINGIATNSIRIGGSSSIAELYTGTTKKFTFNKDGTITLSGISSFGDAVFYSGGVVCGSTKDDGYLNVSSSSGPLIYRNAAGTNSALVVNQKHAGATNNITEFQAQSYSRTAMTVDGGFAIRLTNNTGASSIKGTVVSACTNSPECVMLTPANWANSIGIIAESGVGTNQPVWVVTSGRALVLLKDGTSATNGNWVYMSDTAGRAAANIGLYPDLSGLGGVQQHALEIGHSLGGFTNASTTLIPINIHFQ